jgi:predicted ATP-grasp superfamily ATP-dependent carboligase
MKVPVLLLGAVPRTTTAIARSLHARGIPVDVAATSSLEPRIPSRAIRYWTRLPAPDLAPGEFVDSLCTLIRKNGYDMLIPANDNALLAITRHYDETRKFVPLAAPPPHILNRVLDKSATLDIARSCGLRVPQTFTITDCAQLAQQASQLRFPVILKPGEKVRHEEFKVRRLNSLNEIAEIFPAHCVFSPPMLLQEYCPGEGLGVEILLHDGECVAAFQHRRLKELPHTGGVGVVAISEAPDPDLVRSSLALLRALEWEGVAMVEFRYDSEKRSATLMEVNGRYWGTLSLAIQAGIDFPYYQWQLAHGQRPRVPPCYAVGLRCRWTAGYIRRLRDILPTCFFSSTSASSRRDVLGSLRDFAPCVKDFLWSDSDPMPALFELATAYRDLAVADLRSLRRRLLPAR